jgi:tripartite-type tricarboxylate transporter receptor subunit TctC
MSQMRRRDFVRLAGAAAIALPTKARAQFNASRPITMVVPFPAGGGADILVRMLTKYMSENLSHSIIVQNLPGAGGGIAFAQVARAAPDGHTLGWVSTGFPVWLPR